MSQCGTCPRLLLRLSCTTEIVCVQQHPNSLYGFAPQSKSRWHHWLSWRSYKTWPVVITNGRHKWNYLIIPAANVDSRIDELSNVEAWSQTNNLTLSTAPSPWKLFSLQRDERVIFTCRHLFPILVESPRSRSLESPYRTVCLCVNMWVTLPPRVRKVSTPCVYCVPMAC